MSSIEKMSIQGIRSFGPQKSNMQKIEFCHPLTLILGCNGTGKTTIIECLKYVTTGDQPPGTKGGAFVHDPKIAGEREVKAQVRFQFHDVRGKKIVTTRSLLASQKKNKIECRTLDGAMQRIGADGKPVQITSKCADLNREMIQCLGVSKPILDCVIFCHQEESNWPLSEGKALKVRFDDIFASTRYVKALDNIKKVRSSQNSETTTYKAEIKYLKQNKEKAEELRDSLAEVQMKMDEAMAKVEEANEKLKPVQERKEQITLQTVKLFQVKTEIEKMESEKIQLEKNMSELRSNIRDVFTGSIPELQQMLCDFECEVKEKQDTLCQFENRSGHLSRETDRINKQRSQKLTERGRLTEEAKRHDDNIRKRDAKIRKLVNDYGFDGFSSGEITDDKIKAFGEMMRQKMEELSMEAKNIKDEYEEREHTVQKQLDGVREKKTQLEQSERMKADMVNKNKKEMRSITTELSRVEASAGKLDQIKTDLARGECDLKEAEQSCNIDEMKTDVKNLQKQKTELDNSLKELSNEMTRLHLQSSARTQLDMLKKDKLAKDEKIRKIKAKHEDTLIQIFSSVPESNIGRSVVDYVREQENKIKKMTDSSNKMKMDLSNKETNRKNLREKLQSKEKEMKGYEEQIYEVCAGQDIDDGITSLQEKISHLQDDRGAMVGGKHLYEKFIRQLSRHDPSCPVCHRTFDEEQEVQELVQDLQNQLRIVPSKISKAEKDLEDNQKKYDKLMQLKPAKETMTKLQEEIPDLKNKVDRVTKEMEKLRSDIEESDSNLECIQVDEAIAKSIQPDMTLLDQHMTEVRDLERKIVGQQSKLEGEDSGRTLHQVSNEKDEVQLSLDTVNRNLDHKRQKIADVSEQIQTLKATVNSLQAEKLQIERDLQQRCKLEENKTQLSATNHQLEQEIKDAAKQKQPLQNQIEQLLGQKNAISNEKETRCEKAKNEIIDIKAKGSDVKSVQKEIAKYLTECRDEALEECQNQIQSLEAKLSRLENEKTELCTNIDVLKTELADQKVKERELADNLQLCKKQKEVERIDGKLTVEKTKLSGFNMAHLEKEEKKLGIQLDQLSKEKGRAMTEQIGYEARVDEKKKELATDAYKNAETKFMKMLIKLRTTEVAIQDLDKYYKALDQAIMRYHKVKMDEINKIIRELWSKTYRGNDIDYVEIRSDEDPDSSSKARRSYNYRVVMVKGSTALDLRGRCSAGQKVLASIIIRLALAETFCLNCGVLALDEPTTNLDRENIESLANALVEIIHSREKQVNFQLIVITHDVDFIELLGRAQIVDCFWKISKDADACSRINKRPIHELAD